MFPIYSSIYGAGAGGPAAAAAAAAAAGKLFSPPPLPQVSAAGVVHPPPFFLPHEPVRPPQPPQPKMDFELKREVEAEDDLKPAVDDLKRNCDDEPPGKSPKREISDEGKVKRESSPPVSRKLLCISFS